MWLNNYYVVVFLCYNIFMKIEKYKKLKDSKYELYFDNGNKLILYEDVILKNEILLKSDITTLDLTNYISDNVLYEGYYFLLGKLNYKLLTEKECVDILKKKDYSSDKIDRVLELLKKNNLVNDELYAKLFVEQKIISGKVGPNEIRSYLEKRGIKFNFFESFLKKYDIFVETNHLNDYLDKSIKINKDSLFVFKNKFRQKMLKKGFNMDVVNAVLEGVKINEEEDALKMALKFYKKYEKNDNAFYLVRNALFNKGFKIEVIDIVLDKIKTQWMGFIFLFFRV